MNTFIINNKCLINSENGEIVALLTTEDNIINNTLRASMDLINIIGQRDVSNFLHWVANRLENKYSENGNIDCENHIKELKKLSKDFYDIISEIYDKQDFMTNDSELEKVLFESKDLKVDNNDDFIFLKSF